MTNKEKLICGCLGAFGIIGVIFGLASQVQNKPKSYMETTTFSASVSVDSPGASRGYGIGETPGVINVTASQAEALRNTAKATGTSEQEMENLRVQLVKYIESGQAAADAAKGYPSKRLPD